MLAVSEALLHPSFKTALYLALCAAMFKLLLGPELKNTPFLNQVICCLFDFPPEAKAVNTVDELMQVSWVFRARLKPGNKWRFIFVLSLLEHPSCSINLYTSIDFIT